MTEVDGRDGREEAFVMRLTLWVVRVVVGWQGLSSGHRNHGFVAQKFRIMTWHCVKKHIIDSYRQMDRDRQIEKERNEKRMKSVRVRKRESEKERERK